MLSNTYQRLEKIHNTKKFLLTYRIVKVLVNLCYPIKCRLTKSKFKEKSDVIVSMTSFPARIKKVYLTINSILNQTVQPERIILYLSKEQFSEIDDLPNSLVRLTNNDNFEIHFVDDDIRSHKKYYYAVRDYADKPIITIDDDIIYPEDLIEILLKTAQKHPKTVCCIHAHRIIKKDRNIVPYSEWDHETQLVETVLPEIVPIGCGGVLYPAGCFTGTGVLDANLFKEICPLADDLWLKCHSLLNGFDAVKTGRYKYWVFSDLIISHDKSLTTENVGNRKNDIQLEALIATFPELGKRLIE